MSGEILLARDGDIATVTLSNPGRLNALGLGSWKRLGEVMRELDADKSLGCIVMRGAGDKAFAAGADISEFETTRRNAKSAKKYGAVLEATMGAIARCRHPIVAMIHGVCVGGGLEVITQCDLRICGASSRFGIPIKNLGLVVGYGEMQGLIALVGRARRGLRLLRHRGLQDRREGVSREKKAGVQRPVARSSAGRNGDRKSA